MKTYTSIVSNLKELIDSAIEYAKNNNINKILIFSKNGDSAKKLKIALRKEQSIKVVAVLFPANERFFNRDKNGEVKELIPNPVNTKSLQELQKMEIACIYGTLPLENVIVPGTSNDVYNTIKRTLSLISPGLQLAIQGVLMATDQGILDNNEHVVSIVSDIAVDVRSANSRLMFHPKYGLNIEHIIAQKKKQVQ